MAKDASGFATWSRLRFGLFQTDPLSIAQFRVDAFFWSPDSGFIGFQSGGKLAKIEFSGGPKTICDVQGNIVGGRGTVMVDCFRGYHHRHYAGSGSGGVAFRRRYHPSRKEGVDVLCPSFLPDCRHFLYLRTSNISETSGVYVGSVDTSPDEQALGGY